LTYRVLYVILELCMYNRVNSRIGINRMSITRGPSKSKETIRRKSKKALDKYLKSGGKITEIPEGETTDASTMKFKYRKKRVMPPL
jgi:hypothetical protein